MGNAKPAKTTEIIPYIPQVLSELSFKQIVERHGIRDTTTPQRIVKGENYFHHVASGLNYTYNGFIDSKNICLFDPKTGKLVRLTEKELHKHFKFAGPVTSKSNLK